MTITAIEPQLSPDTEYCEHCLLENPNQTRRHNSKIKPGEEYYRVWYDNQVEYDLCVDHVATLQQNGSSSNSSV